MVGMALNELELQIQRVNRKRKVFSIIVLAPLVAGLLVSSVYTFMPFVGGTTSQAPAEAPPQVDPRASLEAAVSANPKDVEALVALGNAQYDAQDFKQAEASYKRALAIDPINPDVQVDMGTAILYQDRPLEAIAAYRKALDAHPRHVNALVNLGIAYHALGQNDKASQAWHDALKNTSDPDIVKRLQDLLASNKK